MRIIFCLLLFVSTNICAQTIDSTRVPQLIRHEYDSVYPTLKSATWQINTDSLFVASIFMGGLNKRVFYSKEGELKRVITDMPISRTPQYLRDSLDRKYNKNYQILSLTADVKYAVMAHRDEKTRELKDFENFRLLDYTIKISAEGKMHTLDYNFNTHELVEE